MAKPLLFKLKNSECCPQCSATLTIRSGRHGPFIRCSQYPACDYLRSLDGHSDGHIVKLLEGQYCPQCESTLVLRQGRFGMFIGCSNYPDCEFTGEVKHSEQTGVRCPQCMKGELVQRQSRYGKTFYACNLYPDCHFSVKYPPLDRICEYCQFPLLLRKKTSAGIKYICGNKTCGKIASSGGGGE